MALEVARGSGHDALVRRGSLIALVLLLAVEPTVGAQAPATPAAPPPARAYIESVLACERVPLRLNQTPLGEVVRTLQDTVWINVVLDPRVDRTLPVTFQADPPPPLGEVLSAVLRPAGLATSIWCDVLLVHPADAPPPAEPTETLTGALQAYSVQHAVVPFADALESLSDLSGARYELTPAAAERARGATLSLRVRNLPLHHVVTLLTAQVGLRWTLEGGVVWIHEPGEDLAGVKAHLLERQAAVRVTASFAGTPLAEVASTLRALSGVEVRLGPGVATDLSITLRLSEVSLDQALDALAGAHALAWRREGTSVLLVKP